MAKILIAGCSYASGWRLDQEKKSPELWCNILFPNDDITNIASPGANNHWIFLQTAQALRHSIFDMVLVAWSAIPRYHFRVGLELYCTDTKLTAERNIGVVNSQTVTRHWQEKVGDQLRKIHNDHWDILDLVHYVNILLALHPKIYFVNSLLPWSDSYFEYHSDIEINNLDNYTAQLLQASLRDDHEVIELYHHIHKAYHEAGTIQTNHWLNLYQSFDQVKIDQISYHDNHPAAKSHRTFAELLRKNLCTLQNL